MKKCGEERRDDIDCNRLDMVEQTNEERNKQQKYTRSALL